MGRWSSVGRACAVVGSLAASACVAGGEGDELPVGLIEHELADGTVSILEIESVRAWRYPPIENDPIEITEVAVLARGADQQPIGLRVLLWEPSGPFHAVLWHSQTVVGCYGIPGVEHMTCDRFPRDPTDAQLDHEFRVERDPDGDGEIVRAWVRFADDGVGGPREARATFRIDLDDAELLGVDDPPLL